MKKSLILLILFAFLISAVSASASLQVSKQAVSDVVITELSDPAVFNFSIMNLGNSDNFEIYSLVGVDISPRGMFQIASGETKNLQVEIFPTKEFKKRPGIVSFVYKIRGQDSGIQDDTVTINMVDLSDALDISVENINPETEEANLVVENKVNFNFPEINARFTSAFFDKEATFSLKPLERKEIKIPVDKDKTKKLVAGQYMLTSGLSIEEVNQDIESTINFVEKSGLSTREETSGILFRDKLVEKTNEGNVPTLAEVNIREDIVSRLFTTFNINPDTADRNWFIVDYTWKKELKPSETLEVKTSTNYLYPLVILLVILLGIILIRAYTASDLIMRKQVNYVKTKGGEFALKVTLHVRARKYAEKIAVVDRLPAIVQLFERYGNYMPHKYDSATRRLEWDIESLSEGEERVFSYIIFSKVGIVGKFELPAATAIYERDGKIKEASSNKAFFMNEPRRREEE